MSENLGKRRWDLLFNTRRSRRYHEWRIRFFQRFSVARLACAFVSRSAVFVLVLKSNNAGCLLSYISGTAAFLTGLEYAVRFSEREQLHRRLLRLFVELERDILARGQQLTEKQFDQFNARYTEIGMDEPPVLQTLNRLCYNSEVRARYPESRWLELMKQVHWTRRVIASFYGLMPHTHKSSCISPN